MISRWPSTDESLPGDADPGQVVEDVARGHTQLDTGASQHDRLLCAGGDDRSFSAHVPPPVLDLEMEGAVNLQDDEPAVAQSPAAVEVAATALLIAPDRLALRRRHTGSQTQPAQIDLGERLGPARDVAQGQAEVRPRAAACGWPAEPPTARPPSSTAAGRRRRAARCPPGTDGCRSAVSSAACSTRSRGGPSSGGSSQRWYGRRVWWKLKPGNDGTSSPLAVRMSMTSGSASSAVERLTVCPRGEVRDGSSGRARCRRQDRPW